MNDLEELKSLLFGAEKQVLESITERVQQPETRAVDVADVLPDAIRLSHRHGEELVSTLQEPVGQCLRESFHKAPQEYADALYPVMGPAIRRSIVHTLREFVQKINETVDHSLSAKGLKWRFQAWRAGVPFGDYVVQKTLLYRVEQAYLISRENGLLMAHVHHDESRIKDSDAVSAMFSAIQDFVKESFSPDRTGRLETADMGEFTLWAVHGPHALLVAVIRGVPPKSLRGDLSAILERIHFRYGESIRHYSGDTSSIQGAEQELTDCMRFEALHDGEDSRRRLSVPLLVALLLALAALIYFGISNWLAWQQYRSLADVLDDTPGLYVGDIERDGRIFTVRGLRDPLAETDDAIAARAGIRPEQIVSDMRPYQSLESEIRFLRARETLAAPASVSVDLGDDGLVLSGTANQDWIESTRRKVAMGSLGWPVSMDELQPLELTQLQADVAGNTERHFYFSREIDLIESDAISLERHATTLSDLARQAGRLGAVLRIHILGHTDAPGSLEFNERLAEARVDVAAQALIDAGIDPALITRSRNALDDESSDRNPQLRRVTMQLDLQVAGMPEVASE